MKEPRRSALGLLWSMDLDPKEYLPAGTFEDGEMSALVKMMESRLNSPLTSSAGRLFDAVASLLDICQRMEFEAQAAMALEHSLAEDFFSEAYQFSIDREEHPAILDWSPMILGILQDISEGLNTGSISAKFHSTLARMILETARMTGESNVILSGGCFQNASLLELTCRLLEDDGFLPVIHRSIPPNDGGIAPGQVMAAMFQKRGLTGDE